MSGIFAKKSHPERIVAAFETHTELHRSAVQDLAGRLTPEQFDAAIPRAREIVAEEKLGELIPIYDPGREGWWTIRPTERLVAISYHEAARRGEAEWARIAFCATRPKFKQIAAHQADGRRGGTYAIEAGLPERMISPEADYVLEAIDGAIARGQGYVARERQEQLVA